MSRKSILAAVLMPGLLISSPAFAGSVNGTIGVTLTVSPACAVNGGTTTSGALGQVGSIDFGTQPGIFGDVDATLVATGGGSAISILCSPGLTPSMTIGAGAHDSANVRHLAAGSDEVAYRLYTDANRTSEITIGEQISLGTAGSSALTLPIYARVNSASAALPGGTYTDSVQVTLSW